MSTEIIVSEEGRVTLEVTPEAVYELVVEEVPPTVIETTIQEVDLIVSELPGKPGPPGPPGVPGGGVIQSYWRWQGGAQTGAMSSGRVGVNNDTVALATEVRIHKISFGSGTDYSVAINNLLVGDRVYMQILAESDNYVVYTVTAEATVSGDTWIIPVTHTDSTGTQPGNNKDVLVALVKTPGEGKSAYEIAVDNGFVGTEEEWLESLQGADGLSGSAISPFSVLGVLAPQTYPLLLPITRDCVVSKVWITAGEPSDGGPIVVNVLYNGVTKLFTDDIDCPSILEGLWIDSKVPDVTELTAGGVLQVEIVSVGIIEAGSHLVVNVEAY